MDPATNRLLTVTIPGGSTDTWTYDAAGNPLTRTRSQNGTTQVSSYSWDALGNLSSVIRQGTTTLTFTYTPDGRLLQKECGTQVTTYASDFAGVSRESTTSSSPVTYQHGGAGELVSLTWNNQTYYYHFNAHGDTIALSDSTGALVAQYTYDPWGTLTSTTNPSIPNPYLYCGAYGVRWDADLSLYLMGARWYNPATGRFLTKDSYPPDLLAPLTQNPYQYCENNPVNRVDPTGRDPKLVKTYYMKLGTSTGVRNLINNATSKVGMFNIEMSLLTGTAAGALLLVAAAAAVTIPGVLPALAIFMGSSGSLILLGIKTWAVNSYTQRLLAAIGGQAAGQELAGYMDGHGAYDAAVYVVGDQNVVVLQCKGEDGKKYELDVVWSGNGWVKWNPDGENP